MMKRLKELKNEKGSITLFVLIACIFIIAILLSVNIGMMSKKTSQSNQLDKVAKEYLQNETDIDNLYEKTVDESGLITQSDIRELMNQLKLEMYPVGSIYISTNDKNPSEYIGGTWESYGEGRTIVGAGTGTDSNNVQKVFQINETGGEYQHTLTVNEMPSHNHGYYMDVFRDQATSFGATINSSIDPSEASTPGWGPTTSFQAGKRSGTFNITSTGGSQAHNNIQPYIVTYIWRRTA